MRKNSEKEHNHSIAQPPLLTGYAETHVKLAQHRILVVAEDITDNLAADLSALLINFDTEDPNLPIELHLHTSGGAVSGFINIYDVIQMITAPVKTVCLGKCYSAGAFLLAAGTKGERYAMRNSNIMIHGIQAGFPIPGYDMTSSKDYFKSLNDNNDSLMKILAQHTGQTLEKIKEDCKQDVFMDAPTAKAYGIIDHVL